MLQHMESQRVGHDLATGKQQYYGALKNGPCRLHRGFQQKLMMVLGKLVTGEDYLEWPHSQQVGSAGSLLGLAALTLEC